MNKILLLSCFLFLFFATLHAQITVTGTVTDENSQPVPFATVTLLGARDSQLVKGALSDQNGTYSITGLEAGEYRLSATMLGYETAYSEPFTVLPDSKSVSADLKLYPADNMLNEAVVVAKRPLFEQKADRLIMNVDNSPVAAGGTALEILQKMPGVLVIQDRVTLAGNQGVQIWIDGKPSQYADMNAVLRDMPGDQIDRIELITQPGARYDAAGGAIINIILKRNANLGFTGTAALTAGGSVYDQSEVGSDDRTYYRLNPSLSLNYRKNKWNLFGSYSYLHRTYFSVIKIERFIADEVYLQSNYDPSFWDIHHYRMGADFFATKKTTVGVLFRGFSRTGESEAFNLTNVYNQDQSQQTGSFITQNLTTNDRSNFLGNLNLKHEFDAETGHTLNVDFDYSRYDISSVSLLNIFQNTPGSPESRSSQNLNQPIDFYVGQADYVLPLDSTFKAETGIKSSFATIDNDLKFLRGQTIDPDQSNAFLYKENINAAYINLSKKLDRFDFNAGLRAEQTVVTGETMGEKVLDRNYLQWFPSVSALYHFDEHFGLQGAYSRRINRPGFQQQNPFAFFIDSLTYTQGNPQLRPEIGNNAQITLSYDNQPFIRISYGKTSDVIIENAPRLEGTRTFTTAANLAEYQRWAFELNFPIKYKKLIDGFGGNQFIYNSYDAEYLEQRYNRSKWNWLAYGQVNVNLPADFKMEFGGWYMTRFLEEFFEIKALGGLNFGISKTFWDKRGRLSLSVNDILYTQNSNVRIDYADVLVNFFQRQDSRNARLTFSYRFGNTELKNARRRSTGSEDESSRVKVD
ncbi:MAG: TonB-dependent receptor [Saprospiraceae bacterium]|nr:TonB-dependent receptor [Saprospiraceae bacterium]